MSNLNTNNNVNEDTNELLQGQAQVFNHLFGFVHSLAIKSAVELCIADIIHSHGQPMSLSHIASKLDCTSPAVPCLARLMQLLAWNKIFTVDYNRKSSSKDDEGEALYGLTPTSIWLLHDNELSLAPMFLTFTHPSMMAPWQEIGRSINEGGTAFEIAYGESIWEKGSKDDEFNKLFNTGMASVTKTILDAILCGYKEGFSKLEGTLVDVGGGIGKAVAKIVEAHPHIKGINFDQPHVVETAPQFPGITHVGGDMFKDIPLADTVFIKSVLHDWGDDDCIKILKNCQKAVSKNKGKVIIVDIVLNMEGRGLFDETKLGCDLLMMALCVGGKERTQHEWNKLLKEAGFARHNIITIPAFVSIIEAFPLEN
ncbi:(R,S)-reticuline 7-O-methyltransferase-like [Chenopodium quinoa]|uniref:(R,S)-reticuline 7-O-methyltransferase-like n=1 Tax=Chenopodium quinoa TaxID=63459 RepID=UPI000B7808F7|nr:(R,S)-reticuline 7-O-methyltransferase-like [Chenopodium quinoa]